VETDSALMENLDPLVVQELRLRDYSGGRSGREEAAETDGISLRVAPGEIVAVLGENGSGKSLLLDLLTGLVVPKRGAVRIFGHDMAERKEREQARREVGVVFQQPALLGALTVFENVALPLKVGHAARRRESESPDSDDAEVESLLELVGVREQGGLYLGDFYPRQISDGAQRCVALARALAGGRRLLLCDGGTAGLSPGKAYQVDELIGSVVERKIAEAALLFTQSLDTIARIAHRFVLLGSGKDFGKVLAQGDCRDFADDSAVRNFLRQPPSSPWSGSRMKDRHAFGSNETTRLHE
jgi:phospholipid/cholesterol/gamma-HCH transport system ATP-binding protein